MGRKRAYKSVEWYVNGKRIFALGTVATRDLFDILYEQHGSVHGVLKNTHYDEDLKEICKRLIAAGVE